MDKINNVQEQMGNISREMEVLKRNPKEVLEIKNTITEMKNAFGDFPCGPEVKNLPCNTRGTGLIPGQGVKSHIPCSQKTKT